LIPELQKAGSEWGLKVFVQVGTVGAAREALQQGANGIIAQGTDAGGHQWAKGAGLMGLMPEVRDMVDREFGGREVAVLAAGGIADGRGVCAAMALGADGIVMGTRFIVSEESPTDEEVKGMYIAAEDGAGNTVKYVCALEDASLTGQIDSSR